MITPILYVGAGVLAGAIVMYLAMRRKPDELTPSAEQERHVPGLRKDR